jgi:hypothetical protein
MERKISSVDGHDLDASHMRARLHTHAHTHARRHTRMHARTHALSHTHSRAHARTRTYPSSGVGGHDLDASDMRARLAAAHVFHRLLPAHEH